MASSALKKLTISGSSSTPSLAKLSARPMASTGRAQDATGTTKMSDKKRKRLQDLQRREKLKGVLYKKLCEKYCLLGRSDRARELIKATILEDLEGFVRKQRVTESDVLELERHIRLKIRELKCRLKAEKQLQKENEGADVYLGSGQPPNDDREDESPERPQTASTAVSEVGSIDSAMFPVTETSSYGSWTEFVPDFSVIRKLPDPDQEDWLKLGKLQELRYLEDSERYRNELSETQRQIRQDLTVQMIAKKEQEEAEKEAMKAYIQEQEAARVKWVEKEKQRAERLAAEQQKLREDRDEQLKQLLKRREMGSKIKLKHEQRLLQRLSEDVQRQKRAELERRKREREKVLQFIKENEVESKKKAERQQREMEADIKRMEQYARLLEKQEQDRVDSLQNTYARQEKLVKIQATAMKSVKEKSEEDELRAVRMTQEREAADEAREAREKREARARHEATLLVLEKQIAEKRRVAEAEKQEALAEVERVTREVEEANQLDRKKKEEMLQRNRRYRRGLMEQIDERRRAAYESMTATERKLNQKLLEEYQQLARKHGMTGRRKR